MKINSKNVDEAEVLRTQAGRSHRSAINRQGPFLTGVPTFRTGPSQKAGKLKVACTSGSSSSSSCLGRLGGSPRWDGLCGPWSPCVQWRCRRR